MNWLTKICQLKDEVFIDDTGFVYGADGDIGDTNHDGTVLEIIASCIQKDEMDDVGLRLYDMNLTEEEMVTVENNYPGFLEYSGLPKEYAVEHMGWIRVLEHNFEVQKVTEGALSNMLNYAAMEPGVNENTSMVINEKSTQNYVEMTIGELERALNEGRGAAQYYMKSRRPSNLY